MPGPVPVFIHDIATAVPPIVHRQEFLRDLMLRQFEGNRRTQILIRRVYDSSGINRRHTVVDDFGGAEEPLFFNRPLGAPAPSTAERNAVYVRAGQRLAVDIGRKLLADNDRFRAGDVTHVITVSCTGFYAPDPGYVLVRELGLGRSTNRYNIGFMGCFAAFQGLQLAQAFCLADPQAVVMVICVEICSIHLHLDDTPDNIVSASVFADGAAGALISAAPPSARPCYRLDGFATALSDEGERDMTWTIGDRGFDMVLSRYVPAILQTNLRAALRPLLPLIGEFADVQHWAVHPGGRAILDKVEEGLSLRRDQFVSSRHVLANYGNMSSATILFVLEHLLGLPATGRDESVVAMAFGPGITIESGALTRITD
ncbi:MAG TPA: type III polyketide synthase [Woeseiaceae bacterium]|nr:type III polyketide synthase [Woeseiaceae bacterium]